MKVTGQNVLYEWEPLLQETYMPNMKALSEMVKKLRPMLKLSNQQIDRAKTVCPCYRYQGHKNI